MDFNWLDIVLIGILTVTFILGIIKGLIRQIIGILAVIFGLMLALLYYPYAGDFIKHLGPGRTLSQFLGFLGIFLAVLCLGWGLAVIFSKLIKGPLKFMDHILGGGVGLLKGILICGVFVFAMLVFPVNLKALKGSQLAPYCLRMTKAVYSLIPKELKERFSEAYRDIVGGARNAKRI